MSDCINGITSVEDHTWHIVEIVPVDDNHASTQTVTNWFCASTLISSLLIVICIINCNLLQPQRLTNVYMILLI